MNWLEKAEREIEEALDSEDITNKEYEEQMRDLYREAEEYANEEAEKLRRDILGH